MAARDPSAPKQLRLFVAIELPDDVRLALASAMRLLQDAGAASGLRWVRPESIHLTLKFLGATPEHRLPEITSEVEAALAGARRFDLRPEGFGAFHGRRHDPHEMRGRRESYRHNLRVLWVGVAGNTRALGDLAARVESALAPLGFPTEKRAFFAHLTLARVRDDADRATMESMYDALQPYISKSSYSALFRPYLVPEFPPIPVGAVTLMQSTPAPGGAHYDALATFPLTAP